MFRKFIEIIHKAIQWTKKWHFFHVLFIIPGLVGIISLIIVWGVELVFHNTPDHTTDITFENLIFFPIGTILLSSICSFFIAITIEIIIIIYRLLARKVFCVLSPFLNNNKIYNKFYVFCTFITLVMPILLYLIALIIAIIFFPEEIY